MAVEQRRVLERVLVELVVAEDGEHPLVEGFGCPVQGVEHVDHLLAVEGAAEQRREEGVASVQHQQLRVLALELGAQRAEARPAGHPTCGVAQR